MRTSFLCNTFNTLKHKRNGKQFADGVFKCIFLIVIYVHFDWKFVESCADGPIDNNSTLVQVMACHWECNTPCFDGCYPIPMLCDIVHVIRYSQSSEACRRQFRIIMWDGSPWYLLFPLLFSMMCGQVLFVSVNPDHCCFIQKLSITYKILIFEIIRWSSLYLRRIVIGT